MGPKKSRILTDITYPEYSRNINKSSSRFSLLRGVLTSRTLKSWPTMSTMDSVIDFILDVDDAVVDEDEADDVDSLGENCALIVLVQMKSVGE